MNNTFYAAIVLTLAVLIGVAIWQFHSLAWGESRMEGHMAGKQDIDRQTDAARRPVFAVSPR